MELTCGGSYRIAPAALREGDENVRPNAVPIAASEAVPVAAPEAVPIAAPEANQPSSPTRSFISRRDPNGINDYQFITELNRLRKLRGFLNNEAVFVGLSSDQAKTLATLFTLKDWYGGRSPTTFEWQNVDFFNQLFFSILTEAQRRRFMLDDIPNGFSLLPIIFACGALASLLGSVILPRLFASDSLQILSVLSCFLFWLISLGAMGSISFIGMNALSVQHDITFDLLNARLINLRVALGALFALVLTLPFGLNGFISFVTAISTGTTANLSAASGLMLVLPFLLGFSTSLVIMILNRMLEAAQSFFGKTMAPTAPAETAPSANAPTTTRVKDGGRGLNGRGRRPAKGGGGSNTERAASEAAITAAASPQVKIRQRRGNGVTR